MDPHAFELQRFQMVESQIIRRGVVNPRLVDVLRRVPRHCFIPPDLVENAYEDHPLPIGEGQTISQPYIVALMTDLLSLNRDDVVLEIGTGSGYQSAILALLAREVYTVERQAVLAGQARRTFLELGITNVQVVEGDGTLGLPERSPFQAIIVTAAAPQVPSPLLDQLADGGRLVVPVGDRYQQDLQLWERRDKDNISCTSVLPVVFVPLLGEFGWSEGAWRASGS